MPVFEQAFTVRASLAAVAEFHHDARALKHLTPPPLFVQIHRAEALAEGALTDFTLWLGPIPLRWVAVYARVSSEQGFTDSQQRGPLQAWTHTHQFEALAARHTRVTDHIEYEHAAGWRGWLSRLMFNSLALRGLFAYRAWVTRRMVEHERRLG